MRLFVKKRVTASRSSSLLLKFLLATSLIFATGCYRRPNHNPLVTTPSDFARSWRAQALRRPGPIFLDPGHGGKDIGAMSACGQLEKRLNLQTAFALQTALAKQHLPTKLSRTRDQLVQLEQRARNANDQGALMLISLHHNWAHNTRARGIEIFYPREEFGKERSLLSRALADSILLELNLRGFLTTRGVKASGFRVLVNSSMPAILIEAGFMSNEVESRQLTIPARRKLMATSIARGVEQFLHKMRTRPNSSHRSPTAANRVQRPQRPDGR